MFSTFSVGMQHMKKKLRILMTLVMSVKYGKNKWLNLEICHLYLEIHNYKGLKITVYKVSNYTVRVENIL